MANKQRQYARVTRPSESDTRNTRGCGKFQAEALKDARIYLPCTPPSGSCHDSQKRHWR